jgi:hypothetical protein
MFESLKYKKINEEIKDKSNLDSNDFFENNVEEVHLPNLKVSDLIIISDMVDLLNRIKTTNPKTTEWFEKKSNDFIKEVSGVYSDEELESRALYHILMGTDIPEDVTELDLEGDYSIKEFLVEFSAEVNN